MSYLQLIGFRDLALYRDQRDEVFQSFGKSNIYHTECEWLWESSERPYIN